jgi:undecaprenyl diphosphate synthase
MSEHTTLPAHVGIIMDGNGRWAKARGLPRTAGHKEGLTAAKRTVQAAAGMGITYLTLYTFSTENWRRAEEEVSFLMRLIQQHLRKEYDFYRENKIRVVHSGEISALPRFVQKEIYSVMEDTGEFQGMTLNLAINYGGRDEICRAVNRYIDSARKQHRYGKPKHITEDQLREHLDIPWLPEADLIIRTAGEQRTSNFLLWQSAYAELYFSKTLWPDYGETDLREAITSFQGRERRFGGA